MKYVLMFFLLFSTIFDIRDKKIPALWIWSSVLVLVIYRIALCLNGMSSIGEFVFSFIPGILLYVFSCVSNGIGKGDGLLIITTGCFFSWKEHLLMLLLAFFLVAVFAMGVVVCKGGFKNQRIAFVPFLTAASGICLYL